MIFKLNAAFVILASVSTLAQIRGAPLYPRHEGHDDSSAGTPPNSNQPDFVKQNGLDAQALNAKFATIKATDSCTGPSFFVYPCSLPHAYDHLISW